MQRADGECRCGIRWCPCTTWALIAGLAATCTYAEADGAGPQVTLTDCVPAVLRTLAASVALNADSFVGPDREDGGDPAQVRGLGNRRQGISRSRRGYGCPLSELERKRRH